MVRGFENVCEIVSDLAGKSLLKSLTGAIRTMNGKKETKRVLDNLRMLNCMKENFITVAIVCYRYERLAVLQNIFPIILL